MSLITAQNLSKSFGAEDIFSNISLAIPPKARIGMVGPNGSGKTTLIRILLGKEELDSGKIVRAKKVKIGYLPQKLEVNLTRTPYQECLSVFSDLIKTKEKLHQMEAEMAASHPSDDFMKNYGKLQQSFEEDGGYFYDIGVQQVLQGLGIVGGEENRLWKQLSGGQRTRAYMAKILLSNPDLLILDEPTNHLDIQAIEWLEGYLKDFSGSVLMVSHDRYFLNQTVNTIWELSPAFEIYHGNYEAYLVQREERYERQKAEYETQQQFIEKEEEYIRRNIEGQNTRQAQGRRTRLERMLASSRITNPTKKQTIHFHISTNIRSGDLVLRTKNVRIGYQDDKKVLIEMPDVTLLRAECVSILGPNGVGKSTLIKTLLSDIPPLSGQIELGSNLKIGYFAQAHEKLDPASTLMDEISKVSPSMLPAEIRSYLARFLFTGDDVYKTTGTLSGGERGRLALAVLALQDANLLLLDEPMNHLDVDAQETIQALLREFNGTIILVSHDRYLVDAIATQIWEVDPVKKSLNVFKGNYTEFKEWKKTNSLPHSGEDRHEKNGVPLVTAKKETGKLSNNEKYRQEKKRAALEKQITTLENDLSEITAQMEIRKDDISAVAELGVRYNSLETELNAALDEWAAFDL